MSPPDHLYVYFALKFTRQRKNEFLSWNFITSIAIIYTLSMNSKAYILEIEWVRERWKNIKLHFSNMHIAYWHEFSCRIFNFWVQNWWVFYVTYFVSWKHLEYFLCKCRVQNRTVFLYWSSRFDDSMENSIRS